ncbi:hypothetical protein, partial [Yersinia mollaretii]|uniref:hypothetical protein n=1 Tax=Yersinia mollaretii TaxID=33060 RepID=UPI0011A3099E
MIRVGCAVALIQSNKPRFGEVFVIMPIVKSSRTAMDIFQVLEAIKPQDHVVTIQVNSPKDIFDWLIAFSPTVVAVSAIWFSAKQFRESLKSQARQVKLNARIETEGKYRQEWCNSVRTLCAKCVASSTAYRDKKYESDCYYSFCMSNNNPLDESKYERLNC